MDEKENTDFIYYGCTELVGWHTHKPLVLHEAITNRIRTPVVTGKHVFPEYYMIYVEKFQDMVHDALDEWVYFFKHGEIRDDFTSPGILAAAQKLNYLQMPQAERKAYDAYLVHLAQELDIMDTAKNDGIEEGLAKGKIQELQKTVKILLAKKFKLT